MVPASERPADDETRGGLLSDWPGRYRFGRFLTRALAHAIAPTRRNLAYWAACAATLALELALVAILRDGHIYGWEQDVTRLFQRAPGRNLIFDVANFLTNTISWPFAALFAAIVGAVLLVRQYSVAFLLLLTFPTHVLAQFPKALMDRPRPSSLYEGIDGVGGFQSFPSGHAEFVISFYGFLTCFAISRTSSRPVRWLIVGVWLTLTAAIGFGRVAMGRHWPIDILASYVIGAGILSGLLWLWDALRAARDEVLTGNYPQAPGDLATLDL